MGFLLFDHFGLFQSDFILGLRRLIWMIAL